MLFVTTHGCLTFRGGRESCAIRWAGNLTLVVAVSGVDEAHRCQVVAHPLRHHATEANAVATGELHDAASRVPLDGVHRNARIAYQGKE